eukprot:757955-Hanusia_phi.AAC.2
MALSRAAEGAKALEPFAGGESPFPAESPAVKYSLTRSAAPATAGAAMEVPDMSNRDRAPQ